LWRGCENTKEISLPQDEVIRTNSLLGTLTQAERATVASWLAEIAPALAELYASFRSIACSETLAGQARLLSHCIREIRSCLLWHKVAKESQIAGIDFDALAENWNRLGPAIGAQPTGPTPQTIQPTVAVDRSLVTTISDLVAKHARAKDTHIVKITRLFESVQLVKPEDNSSLQTLAKNWKNLTDYFVGPSHEREKTDDQVLTDGFIENVRKFERSLLSFAQAASYFEGIDQIDQILEEANK
jgi:hypothetical protein